MTLHDDSAKKESTGKKRKLVPIHLRKVMSDCEVGDVVQFEDGRTAVMTAWLGGGPFGRYLDDDGNEREFITIPPNLPIERLRGYK